MSNALTILSGRTKRLQGYSYKLSGGGSYGHDVQFPDEMSFDESRMSLVIPFADGNNRDGVGDVLEVTGINVSRHRKNPIVLFDHGKQVVLPIGLAEDRDDHKYTVQIDGAARTATLNAFFYQGTGLRGVERGKEYDHALFFEQVFDMGCKRLVRGGSIGYQVMQAQELPPDYQMGTPKGLHLQRVLMLEGSLVVLPANADTVAKCLCRGYRCCGKPLSPMLVKSLEPYASAPRTMVGYEAKGHECHCGGKCQTCKARRGSVNGPGHRYKNPLSNTNIPAPPARQSWTGTKASGDIAAYGEGYSPEEQGRPTGPVAKPVRRSAKIVGRGSGTSPGQKPPGAVRNVVAGRAEANKSTFVGDEEFWDEERREMEHRHKKIRGIRQHLRGRKKPRGKPVLAYKSLSGEARGSVPLGRIYLSRFGRA